jgi:hypothetical protein
MFTVSGHVHQNNAVREVHGWTHLHQSISLKCANIPSCRYSNRVTDYGRDNPSLNPQQPTSNSPKYPPYKPPPLYRPSLSKSSRVKRHDEKKRNNDRTNNKTKSKERGNKNAQPAALLLQRRPVLFQSIDCVKLKAEENEAATESKTRQRQIGEDGRDRQPDRYLDTVSPPSPPNNGPLPSSQPPPLFPHLSQLGTPPNFQKSRS